MRRMIYGLSLFFSLLPILFVPAACGKKYNIPSSPSPGNPATATPTAGCNPDLTINLVGNLNTALQVNQVGGIAALFDFSNGRWVLPFGTFGSTPAAGSVPVAYNLNKLNYDVASPAPAFVFFQPTSLTGPLDTSPIALPNHTTVIAVGKPSSLTLNTSSDTALEFAWDQPSVYPAACTVVKSFADSAGFTHQVTFLFYQVNDLGALGVNSPPNNQAVYAWYAFDTSLSNPICDLTLLGGTFLVETSPFFAPGGYACDSRGGAGDDYWGDFLYFNSDGSLASEGAVRSSGGVQVQAKPRLLESAFSTTLPIGTPGDVEPYIGVNFGTGGMLGHGLRDGVTGDAAPFSIH